MVRELADETLIVFLSDCHIGGDGGRDIFESPDDLIALFDELAGVNRPVELVLAGDFFDCLRIANVPAGMNRVSATLARPEYVGLFAALRRFAAGNDRHVAYMPGNHDAEVWWNADARKSLLDGGYVHEFLLSYAAAYKSDTGEVIYCEHGNEFDAANRKQNYDDPLDTPLGDHIVTEIIPRLPQGRAADALQLREIDHVFPLDSIPQWIAGRLFYTLVTQLVRWVLLPLLVAYVAFEVIAYMLGFGGHEITVLFLRIGTIVGLLLLAFAVFFAVARRQANRSVASAPLRPSEVDIIRKRLADGVVPPLARDLAGRIAVFVSGHTHAPGLAEIDGPDSKIVVVNSGCWLRQLQPIRAHFHAPQVFFNRFVQTHVRVSRTGNGIAVELWERPRPVGQAMRLVERLAIAGRLPPDPASGARPFVRARAEVAATGAETGAGS